MNTHIKKSEYRREVENKKIKWFYEDASPVSELTKIYGLISNAINGFYPHSEEFGLHLFIDMANGSSVGWTFHDLEDIKEFMDVTSSQNPKDLVGKVIETYFRGSGVRGRIQGLGVNPYVLKRRHYVKGRRCNCQSSH